MKHVISEAFDRITLMGVFGTMASFSLSEWSQIAAIIGGLITAVYVFTNWLFLLRTWWVKEKAHREGRKKPSGFVPLDEPPP